MFSTYATCSRPVSRYNATVINGKREISKSRGEMNLEHTPHLKQKIIMNSLDGTHTRSYSTHGNTIEMCVTIMKIPCAHLGHPPT